MNDLEELRKQINEIDQKMIALFEERMEISLKVGEYKRKNGLEILNREREAEVIQRGKGYLVNKKLEPSVEKFLNGIMEISREVQKELMEEEQPKKERDTKGVIGFQGVSGSFSEQALFQFFHDGVETKAVKEFEDVFIELQKGTIKYGILPIENSSTGGIAEVYDLLNSHDFKIVGEICLKVDQHLMGIKGASLEDITEVYSHPQAFSQCKEFLKQYEHWTFIPFHNTAKSVEFVKQCGLKNRAAIGSERAAVLYDMEMIVPNINYNSKNTTRFIVVGREIEVHTTCNKISMVFSVPHKVGTLHMILQHFADENLNLLKIESRPILEKPWEYLFYVDFEGNLKENEVKYVLEKIKNCSSSFEILGNYERHR